MKKYKLIIQIFILLLLCTNFSCEKLVDIDAPTDKLIREEVFSNEQTAISAMDGIYNELYQAEFFQQQIASLETLVVTVQDVIIGLVEIAR